MKRANGGEFSVGVWRSIRTRPTSFPSRFASLSLTDVAISESFTNLHRASAAFIQEGIPSFSAACYDK
jgi:hypothetical protein